MCRYAMAKYKPHYACFNCRKTFKRKLMWDIKRDYQTDLVVAVDLGTRECDQNLRN